MPHLALPPILAQRHERPGLAYPRKLCDGQRLGRPNAGGPVRVVRGVPLTVRLCAVHGRESGLLHAAALDETLRFLAVDLRPDAPRAARRELLEPGRVVERLLLPVDPAIAERDIERLGVRHRFDVRRSLGDPQPQAGGVGVLPGEPRFPCHGVLEQAHRQLGGFGVDHGGKLQSLGQGA